DRERVEPVVAFRGGHRWLPIYEPMPLPPASGAAGAAGAAGLRPGGVCLITGGLGGLGLELALHLAREKQARLVLVGRSHFPERDRWTEWLAAHDGDNAVSAKIQRLLEIEALGAEVLTLSADVTDLAAMRAVRTAAERRFGAVHAILHTAGIPGAGLIQVKAREGAERVLAPKVRGALVLEEVFADADLDFFAVTSSITALLPQIGQVDYVAANAFLDAFALRRARAGRPAVAIAWDAWKETGMAVTTEVPEELKAWRRESLEQGLASREGVEAFGRILASGLPQVVVSTLDFASRLEQNERLAALTEIEEAVRKEESHPRPALANAYVAPETDLQKDIARVWQEILGIDEVGIHDNFFDLGGNSLAGLRVIQRMKERLQVNLSEVSLYEAPTVGALARLIAGAAEGEAAPVFEQSRSRGERRKARLAQKRGAGPE
ncbi:MAG TPA: SDR family NAD(P)-dependent oxidoreductase, partial [Thermoanaerobaculia bacterium]|nr:SDR family NAD(P)-dependent oxidoreductase [Thermoanaerobaculia bacterium]